MTDTEADADRDPMPADGTPPLGSWNRMYALVLAVLAVEIVLFTIFTKAFE